MIIALHRSLLAYGLLLSLGAAAPENFLGVDSLANPNTKWEFKEIAGTPTMEYNNSRLEFRVSSPQATNRGGYLWLPNGGSYGLGWYVQVEAYLKQGVIPDNSNLEAGLQVEGGSINTGTCSQMLHRGRFLGTERSSLVFRKGDVFVSGTSTKSKSAKLRIHFDPISKLLYGSVNTGSGWEYSTLPVAVYPWGMHGTDTFKVSLVAGNSAQVGGGLSLFPGAVYFKNFRAGPATSEIDVRQIPGRHLRDGVNTTNFGTVMVGQSSTKTYSVLNEGTAPLKKLKVVIDGRNAKDFRVTTALTSNALNPGISQNFKVSFQPTAGKGTRKAKLHILSNDPNEASFDISLEAKATK